MKQSLKYSGNEKMAANGNGNGNGHMAGNGNETGNRNRGCRWWLFARRAIVVLIAASALFVCRWLAYQLRFDFVVPAEYQTQLDRHWHWVILLQLGWLLVFRQFSGIYKYFSLPEVRHLAYAMAASGVSLYGLRLLGIGYSPPLGVILIQCMLGFLLFGAMRL